MIEVRNLTKRFGKTVAVDDLSFDVRPGLVTGFLGPNGSGKSTTMRCMIGLDRHERGTTTFEGRRYNQLGSPLHEVGILLDAGYVHPARSGRNHLKWLAASNGISLKRVDEVLELQDVSKHYRGIPAVRRVSIGARPGQVIGLLGPNGSGKSTTVKMIVGLLRPSRGVVRWNGVDIQQQLLKYQALVGYVPEEPRLYTYLTAVEYLELVGGLRDIPRPALVRRIDRYLELFGLDGDRYAPLSSFSKGMRQKVLIAAALLHDPTVVVLDEPNSGLDVASSLILRRAVTTLAERGNVIIYSSHVLDAVEKVCQEVIILHKSHVVACNSVAKLREMTQTGTLEEVFASVAVDQDVNQIGRDLVDAVAF